MNVLATWLREFADICSDMKPVGQWPGDGAATKLREAAAALATLTQQQGGEQEAGKVAAQSAGVEERAREMWKAEMLAYRNRQRDIPRGDELAYMEHHAIRAIAAALRSKPAASEEDDGDGVANCAECGAFLEAVRPGKHQHPTCSQANTSKQAAGEAVAPEPAGITALREELPLSSMKDVFWLSRDEAQYLLDRATTPPRHPADEGVAMQWPRGVLNRDKTLELLISHNEWRRGKEGPQTDPRLLGLALEATIAALQAGTPSPGAAGGQHE